MKVTAWCCDALEECHWALSELITGTVEALKSKWFGQTLLHCQNHQVIMSEVLCVTEILEYKLDLVPMSVISNEKCNGFANGKYLLFGI